VFSVDVRPQSGKSLLSGKSIRDPSGDTVGMLPGVSRAGWKGSSRAPWHRGSENGDTWPVLCVSCQVGQNRVPMCQNAGVGN